MPTMQQMRDYLAKSGDDSFRWDWPLYETSTCWFSYWIDEAENTFVVGQAQGDHEELASHIRAMATALNCGRILFATKRNGPAFARLVGAKIVATVLELPLED